MHEYQSPASPDQTYSQAYWSAVIAAVLYFILGVILMVNMLGYFLGHYPQHFALIAFIGSQKATRYITQKSPTTTDEPQVRSLEDLIRNPDCSDIQLAGYLALAIQRTAEDAIADKPKYYIYEEWAGFIRLVRFTDNQRDEFVVDKDEQNILNWDWLGESSPLVAAQSEPEWVHGRFCDSLVRYLAIQRQSESAYREEDIHIAGEY